jgi:hypothetical protein
MSFSTQALRYGWVALASLGVITGTTIYIVNNARHQIKPEDMAELFLGVHERCLATQTSTNKSTYIIYDGMHRKNVTYTNDGTYAVPPPVYTYLWPKTNSDIAPRVAFPLYPEDFNSYPGANGKFMANPEGVTGVHFLALSVCYTSFWPDGVSHVIAYSNPISYYRNLPLTQTVNYASSYTSTGGYVWVTSVFSNTVWVPLDHHFEYVTNIIGGPSWYTRRVDDLDCNFFNSWFYQMNTTIKALIPYYVDTNTVYDGTTNIVMLTVTGLWASLGIGDKTNQFTRTPCWTNPVSTNWVVNYTSYWPSTNGTATNINYTSDYRQVVNYAQSWTATGGHVWVTSSNWANSVVTVTNTATYGDYPWQIYVEDLQERYKVLNALAIVPFGKCVGTNLSGNLDMVQIIGTGVSGTNTTPNIRQGTWSVGLLDGSAYDTSMGEYGLWPLAYNFVYFGVTYNPYQIYFDWYALPASCSMKISLLGTLGRVKIWGATSYAYKNEPITVANGYTSIDINFSSTNAGGYGWVNLYGTIAPQFSYCTNKYW